MATSGSSSFPCNQQGLVARVLAHQGDTGFAGAPSWPLRRCARNDQQSKAPSPLGRDHVFASPTHAKSIPNEQAFGYDALRRELQAMLRKEVSEVLSTAVAVTKEPSWVEALKQDIQTMVRNEFSDMCSGHSEPKVHFANTIEMTQPPVSNDASFSLLQEIISEIRSLQSIVLWELRAERKIPGTRPIAVPASAHFECVETACSESISSVGDQHIVSDLSHTHTTKECPGRKEILSLPDCGGNYTCHDSNTSDNTIRTPQIKIAAMLSSNGSATKSAKLKKSLGTCRKACKDDCTVDGGLEATPARLTARIFGRLDRSRIKNKVRDAELEFGTNEGPTGSLNNYRSTGFIPMVAKHPAFQYATVAAIVLNSAFVAVDMDANKAKTIREVDSVFIVGDVTFFMYFAIELLIRFMAYQSTFTCFSDAWFLFDSALLALYALDPFVLGFVGKTWDFPTSFLRLFRLARLFRVTRVLQAFPELLIMIQSMFTALATVGYASILLALATYVFSVAVRSLVPSRSHIEQHFFPNVLSTMYNLILHGTFMDDLANFIETIYSDSASCVILVWIFIVVSAMLLMNMLIGTIVEVVSAASTEEIETIAVQNAKEKFTSLLAFFDHDGDGHLNWDEFAQLLQDGACQDLLKKFNVDIDALIDLAEDAFEETIGGTIQISFRQFIELVLDLRRSQTATVKDVMVIGKRMNAKFHDLNSSLESLVSGRQLDA